MAIKYYDSLNVTGTTDSYFLGSVGIGTTSPSAPLDVRRSDASGIVAEFHNNVGYGVNIDVESDGGNNTISSGSNQSLAFATNGGSNERMRIGITGNVGIGTTSPSEKLDVNGTVNLTNLKIATAQGTDGQVLTSTGSGVAWEDAGGGSGTVTSIVAGTGLTGGTITTSGTIALDYSGNNNFILSSGTQLTSAADDDVLAIVDVNDAREVKYIDKEDFLEDQVTSVTTGEPSGSDSVINIVSLTQAEYDAGTPVATTLYIIT